MTPTAWDVSADAGFYNTGSRIRSGGLTGTITFRPNLARAGNYRVEARWVSAGNRATNASFTVTHRVGSTTVTVDQTQYGGQWRLLGTFDFNSGTAGSVSLASDTANGFVSADAVRWTYMGPPVGPPPGFVAARTNDFATPAGWNASGQVGSLLTPDIGSRAHDPINGALTAIVGASPRARIIGWIEDPETDLPYSAVGAGNYVRAKFSIAYSGPGNSADLALANRVPNFRLGLRTRGVVNTQLEVNHNAQTGGSPVQLPVTRELGPSKDLSAPSVYRVDLDPLEVPYLVQSTTEGIQRTFESLVSGADYSFVSGTLLLVDSVLGTYPVPPAVGAAKVLGTGGVSGNANFDNPGVLLTTLSVPTEQIVRYLTGPNPADYFNPAIVSVTVGESAISLTKSTNGIAVNTTSLPTSRIAVAEAAFIRGTVLDTGATRLRIEPDRLYELTFRVRHGGASSSCPYLRLNLRTVGFGYNVTYELLGGRGLPGPDARTFLAQVLPGNGNLVPGTTADGTTYRMLLNTPLAPDLRADVSGTIAQKFPQLSAQAGPGNPQNDPSLRDLNWGFTVVDSLSLASPSQTDFAEAATDLVLNRIELRTYPQILD
jgi:hypothetical protein